MQEDTLKNAGCEMIYQDVVSGSKADRPGLDRVGRSLKNLVEIIQSLSHRKIGFHSLQENIDTITTGGELFFHIFSALAEFERVLICDRTKAGLKVARACGKKVANFPLLSVKDIEKMLRYYSEGNNTVDEICKIFGIGRSCFYNYLHKERKSIQVM